MELNTDKKPYPILCIDFETSGLPDTGGRPIEFAAALVDPNTLELVEHSPTFHVFIKLEPGEVMDPEAYKIHGISPNYLEQNGITRPETAVRFLQWLQSHGFTLDKERQLQILGQNVQFDVWFLKMLLGPVYFKIFHFKVLDTQPLADIINRAHQWAFGFESMPFRHPETDNPSVSLETQVHCFDLPTDGSHSAIVDVLNCVKVFKLHVVHLAQDLRLARELVAQVNMAAERDEPVIIERTDTE